MKKRLTLCIVLLLTLTLVGWTQSSKKWIVYKNGVDTTLVYPFSKIQIANLRVYVTKLEEFQSLYYNDQDIIDKQGLVILDYSKLVNNKDSIIENKNKVISQTNIINDRLTKDVIKFRSRSGKWPYVLGTGFIGGIVLCLLVK